jgi:hypothetical protein
MTYADDLCVKTSSIEELNAVILELETLAQNANLALSMTKTQIIISQEFRQQLPASTTEVKGYKIVDNYKYLGTKVSFDLEGVVGTVIEKAHKICKYQLSQLRGMGLSSEAQILIYRSQVRSILLFHLVPIYAQRLITPQSLD